VKVKALKVALFLAALGPLARLLYKGYAGMLGANPIEVITHSTGDWTLIFLMFTLAVTPVRRLTGWHSLIRFRRMLGLFAFFYGCLHLTTYVWLDQFFDVHSMVKDIAKRPFITMGMTAFTLMLPLAITSTQGMIRRLGRRWQSLHRLIYFSALAGVVHYWWLVKKDVRKPEIYAAVLVLLLGARVVLWWIKRTAAHHTLTQASAPAMQNVAAD
jgi:sulfoxide reductase heme-binding subunit YedZ